MLFVTAGNDGGAIGGGNVGEQQESLCQCELFAGHGAGQGAGCTHTVVFCAQPDPPGRSVVEATILRRCLDESLRGVNEGPAFWGQNSAKSGTEKFTGDCDIGHRFLSCPCSTLTCFPAFLRADMSSEVSP